MEKQQFHLRSVSDKENYANYLILPLLGLSRFSYGDKDNLVNAYVTVNGKIAVVVQNRGFGIDYWKHPNYLTDLDAGEGTCILYNCPARFQDDIALFLDSKFSRMSDEAKQLIYQFSGLHRNFPRKDKTFFTSRLVLVLERDEQLREQLNEVLGEKLGPEDELEPKLREQDILLNVDSDISFIAESKGS